MKTTATVGIVGSLAVNIVLAVLIAAVFSATPTVQASEVVQCPQEHVPAVAHPAESGHPGGHLVAVRMGWEAG